MELRRVSDRVVRDHGPEEAEPLDRVAGGVPKQVDRHRQHRDERDRAEELGAPPYEAHVRADVDAESVEERERHGVAQPVPAEERAANACARPSEMICEARMLRARIARAARRGAAYSLPLSVRGMKLSAYSRARFSDGLACSTRPSRKKSWIRRAALSCRSPRTCFRAIRPRQLRWMTRLHQLRVKRTSTDRRRCSVWIVRAAECRVSAGDDASGGGEGADDARARGRLPRLSDDDGRRAASWYAERMRASSWISLLDFMRLPPRSERR